MSRDEVEAGWLQVPFFNYVRFVLARTRRLRDSRQASADQSALEVVQPLALVSGIVRLCAIQWYLKGHFWPEVWRGMGRSVRPPAEVYALMTIALQGELPAMHGSWSYQKALAWEAQRLVWGRTTTRRRLRGIGAGPVSRLARPEDAGVFLGDAFGAIIEDFSHGWSNAIVETWESLRMAVTVAADELAELEADGLHHTADRLRRAHLVEIVHGEEAAVPLYRAIIREEPGNAKAHCALGKARLHMGESRGAEYIRRAVDLDATLRQDADGLLGLHEQFMDLSARDPADQKRAVARVGLRHRSSLH
jgi:hypothetical protein